MRYFLVILLLLYDLNPLLSEYRSHVTGSKDVILMGCAFKLTVVAENENQVWNAINIGIGEIMRIENLISSWNPNSQTSLINSLAGIQPVKVQKELYDLIYRSKKVSTLTEGAFDISFASMGQIWNFDKTEHSMPDSSLVFIAREKVNFEDIILNPLDTTVFLRNKGMKIGFGGIGKGYAANKAKIKMAELSGIIGGAINASGDLLTWGESISKEGWVVEIANPNHGSKPVGWLKIDNLAVVTSGNYEKYFTSAGIRYAHIINPKTGYPSTNIASVTIICSDAELADALATSVFILGDEKGIGLINQLDDIECIIVTEDGNIRQSRNVKLNFF